MLPYPYAWLTDPDEPRPARDIEPTDSRSESLRRARERAQRQHVRAVVNATSITKDRDE